MQFHLVFFLPEENYKYLGFWKIKRANFLNVIHMQFFYCYKEMESEDI